MQYQQYTARLTGFKRNALNLAIIAALPIGSVYAAEIKELPTAKASVQSEDSYQVDESTSQKYTQPLLNTAKTITVIPQSVMQDRNVDSLRDALRNVPGISLAAGEGGAPTGDSIYIRGFSARNDIMIDGVRDIAGYTRDTYNIEAVEVAKGPGSAVYGRGATGGSINLQSKTAKLDEFNDLSLRLGTANDYRAQLDSNLVLGETTALRVNLLTDDGEVAGRDEIENSKNAAAVSFVTGLGTDSRFTVNADYQKQDNIPDYGLPWIPNYSGRADRVLHEDIAAGEGKAPNVDYSNFYGDTDRDFEDIDTKSITLKYEKDINDSTTLRVLGRTGTVERESIVNAPRFTYTKVEDVRTYGEGSQVSLGGEKTRDTKDSLSVVQFDLLGSYQLGGIQHDVVAGIELAQEKFERWHLDDNDTDNLDTTPVTVDLANPNSQVPYTGKYSRGAKYNEATGDTSAAYVFDTLTLNSQWQVSAGARYDIFETEYFYQLDDDTDPKEKLDAKDEHLSWSLGVVFKPAKNGSIYLGAGNSFSPSAEDLTASTRGNNADLDAEETLSYELGTKWALFDGQLNASAAIFRTEKTNARTDVLDAEDDREDSLKGKQRVDGLELSAAGQVNKQLSVMAAYTYQDSEVVNAEGDDAVQEGNELARTPEHSFSIWSRYAVNEKLNFGLGTQYVGERFNSSDPGGRETASDYLIWDMMVSYQISNQWGVQMNGSNLTDEEYEDQLGGGHFIPGEGRYVALSSTYSF
jgi:catecholate siderophore receptor